MERGTARARLDTRAQRQVDQTGLGDQQWASVLALAQDFYGWLANRSRAVKLERCRQLLEGPAPASAPADDLADYRDRYQRLTGVSGSDDKMQSWADWRDTAQAKVVAHLRDRTQSKL
ncbi:hypothetical protein [Azoarcus sp. DD4]|uniref:hypothetical protein n=1 Tax=Azoarcus sp. DD4 TaxID=2027405 RepID=UPI00112DA751|nr:hypothetical protein [Azoarcus sp. DD4]